MSPFVREHLGRARKALALAAAIDEIAPPVDGVIDSEAALRCALAATDEEWAAIALAADVRSPSETTRAAVVVLLAARVVAPPDRRP